jgi:hypothetical protein
LLFALVSALVETMEMYLVEDLDLLDDDDEFGGFGVTDGNDTPRPVRISDRQLPSSSSVSHRHSFFFNKFFTSSCDG